MEDTTRGGTTFIDEVDDFDMLLADDEAPSPVRRMLRPRKRDAYRPKRLGRSATPNWSRIAAALFVAAVVLFMVGFGIKSFLDHRKAASYEAYFGKVAEVTAQSDVQGKELSSLLSQPTGADRTQLIARLDRLTKRADSTVRDARAIEAPEELATTHQWLVTTLEYRRNGLDNLRSAMTAGLSRRDKEGAAASVAAANQRLEASDVIYDDSYALQARSVLDREEVDGVRVPDTDFVTDPEFTSVKAIKLMLERLTAGVPASGAKGGKKIRFNDGKTRGGQLGPVVMSPSGQTLSTTTTTEVAGSDNLAFEVSFENQGEVQATQVPVTITIKGEKGEPQQLTAAIESVDPGQVGSVRVPFEETPPFGETLTVTVQAGPVPGEERAENNAATFTVRFRL